MSGLTSTIKRARNLSATEGTVRKGSTIFTCKRYTLCHALIDDVVRHLSETMYVGFASAIVTTFQRIVEQTPDAVAVVLVILGGIDSPLSSNTVGSPRAVLKAERLDVVT